MSIDVVVFLPGICGSVLKEGDETIWPGTPWNVKFETYPDHYVDLLATSTTMRATEVLRDVPLTLLGVTVYHFDGYGRALKALEAMGFHETGGGLISFAYDWRMDVRTSAATLHARLSKPDLRGKRIAIVAHSMGGLVARYALEKLGIPQGVRIELCALVATPHLGAPVALQNVLGLRPEIFLSAPQCRAVLRNPAFPSAYQLLPHMGVPTLLEANAGAGFIVQDPFDAALVGRLGLVAGSLAAATGLYADLPFMGPGFQPPCRYVAIAGNAQKTVTANYLDDATGAKPVEEPTAGDGTVPLWSAAAPGIPVRYVSATHGGMFADSDTIAMLRAVLRPGTPGARLFSLEPGPPVLSAQAIQPSVKPGQPFTIAVIADRPTDRVDAVLEVTRAFDGERTETQEVPLRYDGGFLRSIPMDFVAPDERAVVQVRVRQGGVTAGDVATVLVVK
jgi:pimeloyl-ACP methyl ester carboxylesterase